MTLPATLAEGIHRKWAADVALSALLPVSRFLTGRAPEVVEMPYCRLEMPGGSQDVRTNKSLIQSSPIVFHVWTDGFDEGDRIANEIERVFQNCIEYQGGTVLDATFVPHTGTQLNLPEIRAWETICNFTFRTWQARSDI